LLVHYNKSVNLVLLLFSKLVFFRIWPTFQTSHFWE